MTRRRRLRTRTLVLSLAAALAGAIVLPALGAPDPVEQALRSWDAVIGDGRSGEPLPLQVIVVLAAQPAAAIDSPNAVRTAAATQQLDLDALARVGIAVSVQYRFVNALNAVSATVRAGSAGAAAGRARGRRRLPGAQALSRPRPSPQQLTSLGAAARPIAGRARRARA